MPGQQKGVFALGAGRQVASQAQRADGIALRSLGTELAIGGEIVPEEQRRIPPFAFGPAGEVGDLAIARAEQGEGEAALHGIGGVHRRIAHEQPGQRTFGAVLVGARGIEAAGILLRQHGILDGPGDRGGDRPRADIFHAIAQDGHGQAGFILLVGDEGREGFERDTHGQGGILEFDAGEGIFADEAGGAKAGETGGVACAEAILTGEGRQQAGLQDAGDFPAAVVHRDGGKGIGEAAALVWAIEDFPIAQLAASAERDAAGGDASQWKRQLRQLAPGEDAGESHGTEWRGAGGRGYRRRGRLGRGRGDLRGGRAQARALEEGTAIRGHRYTSGRAGRRRPRRGRLKACVT